MKILTTRPSQVIHTVELSAAEARYLHALMEHAWYNVPDPARGLVSAEERQELQAGLSQLTRRRP